MSGIFPDESSGGVPPEDATNSYEPENTPTCDPRFFGRECQTVLRPDQLNALISEILCAVDTLGSPYNCALVCNLGAALQFSFDAVYARINDAIQGLDIKESVRAATTANIVLSGLQTVDGVNLATGNRVLVKNQTTASQNGIYVVAVGAWARSEDANTSPEVTSGMYTFVSQGTIAGKTGWVLTTPDPIVLNTTALTFEQFSAAGQVIDGPGLFFSGNILGVGTASSSRIVVNANNIDLATTGVVAGSYGQVLVDAYGRVIGGGNDIADNVNVSPFGGISSTNVQDALEELDTEKARKDANLSDMVDKKASRFNLQIQSVQIAVADANVVVATPATYVIIDATLTAARNYTLPAANLYNAGESILLYDRAASVTVSNKITVQRAGTDTVNGVTTAVDAITVGGGRARLVSNGSNRWDLVEGPSVGTGGLKLLRISRITTLGAGIWARASDVSAILVKGWGAGGGGGGATGTGTGCSGGAGGGGGSYAETFITTPAASYNYNVGTAGGGGPAGGAGFSGGNTTFDTLLVANGGGFGTASAKTTAVSRTSAGGSGGIASAGDVQSSGEQGGIGILMNVVGVGGSGGAAACGGGAAGAGGADGQNGGGGRFPGGGGGGGCEAGASGRTGGTGGNGYLIIYEFGP